MFLKTVLAAFTFMLCVVGVVVMGAIVVAIIIGLYVLALDLWEILREMRRQDG